MVGWTIQHCSFPTDIYSFYKEMSDQQELCFIFLIHPVINQLVSKNITCQLFITLILLADLLLGKNLTFQYIFLITRSVRSAITVCTLSSRL